MNASNLYTFTKFKGYDPEVGMTEFIAVVIPVCVNGLFGA